jgi:hypothetical protein
MVMMCLNGGKRAQEESAITAGKSRTVQTSKGRHVVTWLTGSTGQSGVDFSNVFILLLTFMYLYCCTAVHYNSYKSAYNIS